MTHFSENSSCGPGGKAWSSRPHFQTPSLTFSLMISPIPPLPLPLYSVKIVQNVQIIHLTLWDNMGQ